MKSKIISNDDDLMGLIFYNTVKIVSLKMNFRKILRMN